MKRIQAIVAIIGVVLLVGGFLALRGISGSRKAEGSASTGDMPGAGEVRIGAIDNGGSAEVTQRGDGLAARPDRKLGSEWRSADGRSSRTVTATADEVTSDPLRQEEYIAALMAMMEKDGKDNALLHYALAFELAPDNPTDRQLELIKRVMEEGWSEDAEELLPYLEQWDAAFAKLYEGAHVGYARGIGTEMGADTPVFDFLKAQNSARMLAVYSRYLEAQGRGAEAMATVDVMMSMGRDFNSPDNLLISTLVGTAMQNMGLKQISEMAQSGTYKGHERQVIDRLRQSEQAQASFQQVVETETWMSKNAYRELLNDPEVIRQLNRVNSQEMSVEKLKHLAEEFDKTAAMQTEYFSKPYWDRQEMSLNETATELAMPNFMEAEVRYLNVVSRSRQQQIDLAAQAYMAQHQVPPPDTGALVSGGYLPEVPTDPFTGQDFVYKPTENGYELYGSGPVIDKPVDPAVEYNPVNGTVSDGVIRLR